MEIRPIFSTLRRHRMTASLIVLEIALACAIICNAVFLITARIERMQEPSGLVEQRLVRIRAVDIGHLDNRLALNNADLDLLRRVPGVQHAAALNQVPFGNNSWNSGVRLDPEQQTNTLVAAMYMGSEDLLSTLGLKLTAGRDFRPDEYRDESPVSVALINGVMAERLFPGEDPVGKVFHRGSSGNVTVIGVVDPLVRPNSNQWGTAQYAMILPIRAANFPPDFVLNTEPSQRAEVLEAAVAALEKARPGRVFLDRDTISEMRDKYYQQDRSMAWLLVTVCVALLVVTALGIVGLASFWVQQRTRMIGIRRALGATRGQILRYFQIENFLLTSIGVVLGMLLAYVINMWLMAHYELPRLPLIYLPVGAVLLWLLGQVAVLGPARRAAAVPPAVATRSA